MELAKARKERRDGPRRSVFVPQTAAKQFAATATPMKHEIKEWSQRHETQAAVNPPPVTQAHAHLNPKQFFAAVSTGMSEAEAITAVCHANEHWNQRAASKPTRTPTTLSAGSSSTSSKDKRPRKPSSESRSKQRRNGLDDGRHSYKPGDAEKRRTQAIKRRTADVTTSFQDIAFGLQRDEAKAFDVPWGVSFSNRKGEQRADMPYDMTFREADEDENDNEPLVNGRPKYKASDRPTWDQESQCDADDVRGKSRFPLLHFRSKPAKPKETNVDELRRSQSECRARPQTEPQVYVPRRGSDNLVADAVKIIKKEEKAKRRESVMNFIKKVVI